MDIPACIERVIAAYEADSKMVGNELHVSLYNERTAKTFYKLVSLDYGARLEGSMVVVDMSQPVECD